MVYLSTWKVTHQRELGWLGHRSFVVLSSHHPVLLPPFLSNSRGWILAETCPYVMCQAGQAELLLLGKSSPVLRGHGAKMSACCCGMLHGTPGLHDTVWLELLPLEPGEAGPLYGGVHSATHVSCLLFHHTRLENEGCTRLFTRRHAELMDNFFLLSSTTNDFPRFGCRFLPDG